MSRAELSTLEEQTKVHMYVLITLSATYRKAFSFWSILFWVAICANLSTFGTGPVRVMVTHAVMTAKYLLKPINTRVSHAMCIWDCDYVSCCTIGPCSRLVSSSRETEAATEVQNNENGRVKCRWPTFFTYTVAPSHQNPARYELRPLSKLCAHWMLPILSFRARVRISSSQKFRVKCCRMCVTIGQGSQ